MAVRIRGEAVDSRTADRYVGVVQPVNDGERGGPPCRDEMRTVELQEMHGIECVECPEHVIERFHLLLTSAHRREDEVEQDAPELCVRLCGVCDARDEEVVKLVGERASAA